MRGSIGSSGIVAAAIAAMLLSACGGGGGGPSAPGGGGGTSGPTTPSNFGQGARGVTVAVSRAHGASAIFGTSGGGDNTAWTNLPSTDTSSHKHMDRGIWPGVSRRSFLSDLGVKGDQRIAVYSRIEETKSDGTEDADYLVVGYWNRISGEPAVEPFYWGSMRYTGNVEQLTGSVTYNKNVAAGSYETQSGTTHRGYFVAGAELTANFDAANGAGTLSGRIYNFEFQKTVGTRPDHDGVAEVTLDSITLGGSSFSGATDDGGTWSGLFFGPADGKPTGVAGVFDATTDATIGGSTVSIGVTGAFGAESTP